MKARLRKLLSDTAESFWPIPAAIVVAAILLAVGVIGIDRRGAVPNWLIDSAWLYNGGATGARTLLGSVASSTIGVAGTVFSITIAALSLAAGQMGPRLLRNFTRDRANQVTLGIFLGTFAYALMVLRSVRTPNEGAFIPHLALSISIFLALLCVGTLVFFVSHMAGRINVETVIELVSEDVRATMQRVTVHEPQPKAPPEAAWRDAEPVGDPRRGYLQHLNADGLADWAAEHGVMVRLLVRPGDYVFPGAPVALATPGTDGVAEAVRDATALGPSRVSSVDLGYAIGQLVEVAVRALSPGINDPHTAIGVLDRLGASLCDLVGVELPSGVWTRQGRVVLIVPELTYEDVVDVMFNMIRHNGEATPAVLERILTVLTAVACCETRPERRAALRRHADLAWQDAQRCIGNAADLGILRASHAAFAEAYRGDVRAVAFGGRLPPGVDPVRAVAISLPTA